MSSTDRMAALVISVADAKPLKYLQGALNSACAFHKWAEGVGYDAKLLTDEEAPLTVEALGDAFSEILGVGDHIHRLVIYFAGHGLIREVEENFWLLSDWWSSAEAVNVGLLRRQLSEHPIDQIAIIADACSLLPATIAEADLGQPAVLRRGPNPRSTTVAVDRFSAAQDGTATYVIPAANPADDRCLFTGVLVEGLWGKKPEAFSKQVHDSVTSSSLGEYLKVEVPQLAQAYGRTLYPVVLPMFPEGDNIYFSRGSGAVAPPLDSWPTGLNSGRTRPPEELIEAPDAGASVVGSGLENALRAQRRPNRYETGSGFAIEGDTVTSVWTPYDVVSEPASEGRDWWRVRSATGWLERPVPSLIELGSGNWAAVVALPEFVGSMIVGARGVEGLIYREVSAPHDVAEPTERALGALERGGFRVEDLSDLAVELRQGKHADPVRGVISAYLYDSIGDIDSIRRMASFYLQHGQPIPYDIALLGLLEGELRDGRALWATVPAVPAREPRTDAERAVGWSYQATPGGVGPVGGLWPWLRQGWVFLDDPSADGSTLVLPAVAEVKGRLTSGRVATLDQGGGEALARMLELEQRI